MLTNKYPTFSFSLKKSCLEPISSYGLHFSRPASNSQEVFQTFFSCYVSCWFSTTSNWSQVKESNLRLKGCSQAHGPLYEPDINSCRISPTFSLYQCAVLATELTSQNYFRYFRWPSRLFLFPNVSVMLWQFQQSSNKFDGTLLLASPSLCSTVRFICFPNHSVNLQDSHLCSLVLSNHRRIWPFV